MGIEWSINNFYGKASLAVMLSNPPLTSPSNVTCCYLCSKDVYINMINSYYRYACGKGLFSGEAPRGASTRKLCLLAQLVYGTCSP